MYNCIIVDDEALAIKRVTRLLEKHSRSFSLVATFSEPNQVIDFIKSNPVHVVFLDIEMPEINGMELIKQIPRNIYVVFITAFKEFALDAFENDALDYLLKPVSQERFDKSILKIERHFISSEKPTQSEISYSKKTIQKIPVKTKDGVVLIDKGQIAYFKADNKYVEVFANSGNKYLIEQSLNSLASNLPQFLRIHKGILVNTAFISEIKRSFNSKYKIILSDSARSNLLSGRSYTKDIKAFMEL